MTEIIGHYIATLTDGSRCAVDVKQEYRNPAGMLIYMGLIRNAKNNSHLIFFNQAGKLTEADSWIAGDLEHIIKVAERQP